MLDRCAMRWNFIFSYVSAWSNGSGGGGSAIQFHIVIVSVRGVYVAQSYKSWSRRNEEEEEENTSKTLFHVKNVGYIVVPDVWSHDNNIALAAVSASFTSSDTDAVGAFIVFALRSVIVSLM